MRRIALLAGILLLAPLGTRAEDQVIYPRSAPSAGTLVDKPASGPSPVLLVAALIAAGAGGWLLWRQRRSPKGFSGGQARKLSVAESRSLGNRQYLVVADYNGRKFLIGVCPGRIDMLAPLGDDAESAP
jgi:flagellar protein FliO/FliZ